MKKIIFLFSIIAFFSLFFAKAEAQSLAGILSGKILLDVERNGEAWYIYPLDNKRYYLGRPHDAFDIMRNLGLGISEYDFQKISEAGMLVDGDLVLAKKLSGRIILQVEKNGEAWYINPVTYKKHYLGRPNDAFNIMRELGLGISRRNLALIHKNTLDESINQYSSYSHRKKIVLNESDFFVDFIEIDLNNPNLKIITETANSDDCLGRCSARPLIDYVCDHEAFAAINGSYFDTSIEKMNYYFAPVYNTRINKMINISQLRYSSTGPIVVFDQDNNFYYFKDVRDFVGVDNFQEKYNTKIQAAISNLPRLIEDGKSLLIEWSLDGRQLNNKASRSALAHKKGEGTNDKGGVYLLVLRSATIDDLAEVLKLMKMDWAINLDGGYSTALYYNGEYMMGPGRNIPNAILFAE